MMTVVVDHRRDIERVQRIVVVAPTFDNANTLPAILSAVEKLGLTIIVVNDGSTDATGALLLEWERQCKGRVVVGHPANRGKAAAIRTGFERAAELGFTHVLTIDTDGQHDPGDIPAMLDQSILHPDTIVLGNRAQGNPAYPRGSLIGRRISNFLVGCESGLWVNDSQCGLRIYPLESTRHLKARSERYAFETEILAYAGFAGIPVVEIPVRCIYQLQSARVTHFRPWVDSMRAALLHCRLLAQSAWPWGYPATGGRRIDDPKIGTLWSRFARWASPVRSWKKLRYDMMERDRLASSLGWGAFMAMQPAFGLKTLTCLALSKFFRLQPVVVLAVSSLTSPPWGVAAWTLSIIVGDLLIHGRVTLSLEPSFNHGILEVFRKLALEWCVGALALGSVLGFGFSIFARLLLRQIPLKA